MPNDDLDYIPSIVPTRDGAQPRSVGRSGAEKVQRSRNPDRSQSTSSAVGTSLVARLAILIALIIAVVGCVWAWQLQAQLLEANEHIANYASRIGDLEARLSDTDEGMNQNAEVQAKKAAQLEAEVRKLWDNVWKETKDRLGKLEAANAGQNKSVKGMEASLSTTQSQLREASAEIVKLNSVAGDLARLMSSAKASQAEVERVADTLNRIELSLAKLDKRVAGNEEWVGSVNAFRKQINTSLSELQATVRSMQATP
jgi:chromosome segregation ATPase